MTGDDPTARFLEELAAKLPRSGRQTDRILSEIEAHLLDRVDQLTAAGLEKEQAAATAIAQFGTAPQIVKEFVSQVSHRNETPDMFRYLLTFLSVTTIAYAALHLVFGVFLSGGQASFLQRGVYLLLAACVIVQGVAVLRLWWSNVRQPLRGLVFGGGLALIALGAANAIWCAHLGMTTGDWEYYGFVGGALLATQGVLSACLWGPKQLGHAGTACS